MFKHIIDKTKQTLQSLQPCVLCHTDRQHIHSICLHCWQQLPWSKNTIQRHEIDIQVACHYQYPIDRIIQQFKYEQQLQFQNLLAGILLQLRYGKIHAIVPMPISTDRLVERGYNQALVLTHHLAQNLQIPIWQPIDRLKQHSQKGLSRLERLGNIEQQFQINPTSKIKYRNILILDDVVTTGSSIFALKQKLELLGCQKIKAVCLASAEI